MKFELENYTGLYTAVRNSIIVGCRNIHRILNISAGTIKFQEHILDDVVIRTLKDIHRWRVFQSDKIHNFKIACFAGYWIVKLKPFIYFLPDDFNNSTEKRSRKINEIFALFFILQLLVKKYEINMSKNFINFLLYSLRYRLISSESMILMMELIKSNIQNLVNL